MLIPRNQHFYDASHTNEAFLGQLKCEATGDFLQFVIAIFTWVDFDSGFGSTERYIDASTLERHQG